MKSTEHRRTKVSHYEVCFQLPRFGYTSDMIVVCFWNMELNGTVRCSCNCIYFVQTPIKENNVVSLCKSHVLFPLSHFQNAS